MADIHVRCPDYLMELVDSVCSAYGFTRAELMRSGTINYCRELLATDMLKQVCDMAVQVAKDYDGKFNSEQLSQLMQLQETADQLTQKLGLK